MNILTYFGFLSGDGLSDATSFQPNTPPSGAPMGPTADPAWKTFQWYSFDKKAAYYHVPGTMMAPTPANYKTTDQVYIIRHADGTSYSKFQISDMAYSSPNYAVELKFVRAK
jgi:hypothetical protein